jgi:LytS/YehU family sensor histidine kinase
MKTESLDKGFQVLLKEKENDVLKAENSVKEAKLRQKDTFLLFFIVIIFLFVCFVFFILRSYRRKRNHARILNELNKKLSAQHEEIMKINGLLRLKILRTQMNPHFIYNCLNSINHLVLKGQQDMASGYLLSFAKLLRLVLDFSDKDFIELEEEIQFLNLYLSLEAMRFGSDFHYEVFAEKGMLEDDISLPSLMVQPFVENAIWHGLMNKEGEKKITVSFGLTGDENKIRCVVDDNGVGRQSRQKGRSVFKPDHESKGIRITQERIEMLQFQSGKEFSVMFTDHVDGGNNSSGTRVELVLPIHNQV